MMPSAGARGVEHQRGGLAGWQRGLRDEPAADGRRLRGMPRESRGRWRAFPAVRIAEDGPPWAAAGRSATRRTTKRPRSSYPLLSNGGRSNHVKIVVTVKLVPNPNAEKRIDPQTKRLVRTGVETVLNPYDEYALEAALQLKERAGGDAHGYGLFDGARIAEGDACARRSLWVPTTRSCSAIRRSKEATFRRRLSPSRPRCGSSSSICSLSAAYRRQQHRRGTGRARRASRIALHYERAQS